MKISVGMLVFLALQPFASAGESGHPAAVSATLSLPWAKVLPGVPFDMIVTMRNDSAQTAAVGISARLIVILPDGTRFAPAAYHRLEPDLPAERDQNFVELAPGKSRQFAVTWWNFWPNWSHYDDYASPGQYEIALELGASNTPQNYVGSITTNTARLERAVPHGEDEALWKRMQAIKQCGMMYSTTPPRQICHGGWPDDGFASLKEGVALAREIRDLHPASQYYPYAILMQFRHDSSDLPKAMDAAERFPDSPAHPYLLILAAEYALSELNQANRRHDSAGTDKYLSLADDLYAKAIAEPLNVSALEWARRGLAIVRESRAMRAAAH